MIRALLRRLLGGPKRPVIMGSPVANAMVRDTMAVQGDDGSLPRQVTHFAYPKEETSASRFEVFEFLSQFDLVLSEAAMQNGVIFEHRTDVASAEFDEFTGRMFDELLAMGWEYDGWECPIVKG